MNVCPIELQKILETIQDAGQYLEGIRPKPSEFDPVHASRKKIFEAAIAVHRLLEAGTPGVKPWDDPSRSPEDRAAWIEAGPESLPDMKAVG